MNPNSFLKNVRFYQRFSIFFTSRAPPKSHVFACNQGQPPRNQDLSEKTYTLWIRIQTRACGFSIFQKQQTYKLVARHRVVYDLFHVHDPKNYMDLAADPHLKTCCFRESLPGRKNLSERRSPWKNIQRFGRVSSIFQKQQTCELVARHSVPRYELVDLLFFDS